MSDLSEEQELCTFCSSQEYTGPTPSPIPRPYPDYEQLPAFHYLPYNQTPNTGRLPDDYQPRAQLKIAIENKSVTIDNAESIHQFSQKYIVSEEHVKEYVEHVRLVQTMKAKRAALADDRRKECIEREYDEYNWESMYNEGSLSTLRVSELNKYLTKHGLPQQGKKTAKVELIRAHIGKTVCSRLLSADDQSDESGTEEVASASDSESEESEAEVLLELLSSGSDSDTEIRQEEVVAATSVSMFGRRRQQKIVHPDYILY